MPTLQDIKRRRASVQNTQKITRAMKMVAAAKLRRAQDSLFEARPYALRLRELINDLATRAEPGTHPLLRQVPRADGSVTLIVVTGDRGLCGAFNSNIINRALRELSGAFAGRPVSMTVIGRKGVDLLTRKTESVDQTYTGVLEESMPRAARKIIAPVADTFAAERVDEVYCLYNEFNSAISQRVTFERLLPFEPDPEAAMKPVDYAYEPGAAEVYRALLTRHMEVQMHRILLESAASEYGARMTAMESATNNAADMIDRLTLLYNRARQDAITKELIEVVSGSNAL